MRQIIYLSILVYSLSCGADEIKYHINDMFSISISDKMEIRKEDDAYTQWMNDVLNCSSEDKIVFQQKGLADFDQTAMMHYARILIKTEVDEECGFPAFNDANFQEGFIKELENACAGELASGQSFLTAPKGKVEEIGNGVRINIKYRRTGTQGAVKVWVIYIFNYRYAAKIIASYRECEESIWQAIIEQAINSIEWDESIIVDSVNYVSSQKDSEFMGEVKSADNNGNILGPLVGFLLMVCVVLTYRLCQSKRVKRLKRWQKKYNEDAIRKAVPLVTNNEFDKAENVYEKHCDLRESRQLERVEKSKKQVYQKVDSIAFETKKVINEYTQYASGGNGIQRNSAKKETDSVLKKKQHIRIDNKERLELKEINDKCQHGEIPEQTIIQTNYPVPNVKQLAGYYCFALFPKTETTVFPYRKRRVEKRGYTEVGFESKLIDGLVGFNYKVLGDVSILPVDGVHPYEPDIAIIEKGDQLGIRIDIEIDEPYTGFEPKAIHYIGCGDEYRDANLCNLGWIVIRFSEKQVYTEAEKCISYIKHILSLIDNAIPSSHFESPQADKRWTSTEAVKMAAKGYRESYLNQQFNQPEDSDDAKLTALDIKQTELEKEAAKLVQKVVLPQNKIKNIDKSTTIYDLDNRLGFEAKEHIYVLDGVVKLKAVSDVIAHFFCPFNILEQSKRYANKNGMSQNKVIEMWDSKGVESRNVGTFLHEQIENNLKGERVLFDYPFEYDGEIVNYKKTISIKKEFGYFLDFMRDSGIKPFRSEWRIFDERNKIAGTIDLICRNGSQFDIYDWKRSTKASPNETVWQHGRNGLEHVPDISFYKYALQQNLYKYILENNYGVKINKMYLVVLHPDYSKYVSYEVPRMDKEITIILKSL